MEISYLRASSIGTFKDCSWKYFLDYSVGLASPAGKKAQLGTICHHLLEILAKAKKTGHDKLQDKYTNPEYLLKIIWDRNLRVNPQNFDFTKADFKFCKNCIDTVLKSRYNPLKANILAVEKQFEIDLNDKGFGNPPCKLRGTVDLITEEDSETLHIVDYKSGECKDWITGQPKKLEDFEKDIQVLVYNLALSVLYPQYKYRLFTIYYIRDGGPFTVSFGPESIPKTINMLRKYYKTILGENNPKRLKDDASRNGDKWKCKYVCHYGKTLNEKGVSLCDQYHYLRLKNDLAVAATKIQQLSVEGKPVELSRRNDYSRAKIAKASLK